MKIAIDAMGGDNAPKAIVEGSIEAVKKLGVDVILFGDKQQIEKCLNGFTKGIEIVHTTEVIDCNDDPALSVRRKKDSSIVVGMKAVAEGKADAFVSAGSTGAVISGATLIVKRIKGIRRVALGTVLPTEKNPALALDCGANADCTPEFLAQFAIMGSAYAKGVMGIKSPKIALFNNGVEENKGCNLTKEAYQLLSQMNINFYGNIEAKDIFSGDADVIVFDGFTGNAALKTVEGTAKYMGGLMKNMFKKNIFTKLCAIILKSGIKDFKSKLNADEEGGAPVLGAEKVVIKAHGSSNSYAFYNAIRQAKKFAENDVINIIKENI